MKKFSEFLAALNIDAALAWAASDEQWLFVTDLLEEGGFPETDFTLTSVEARFDQLLDEAAEYY